MLTGVIEGFYGRAWRQPERVTMLEWIADAGMNTFIYAPKDDIHVRARWREPYGSDMLAALAELRGEADRRGVAFNVAIAPCLDITYSDRAELEHLQRRIQQLTEIGVERFTLLFDDIPNQLPEGDQAHFPSFAAAQSSLANAVMTYLRSKGGGQLLFCPTEYCARFANMDVPNSEYLNTLGRELDPEIGVFWTGPEVVSPEITAASLEEVGAVLGRKPIIWENFHANDYDVRRVCTGPLGGRASDILPLIAGFITNPNNELNANFVPIRTTGRFLTEPSYAPDAALAEALAEWRPAFRFAFRQPAEWLPPEEIRLLVELLYQPFNSGPEVTRLLETSRRLLAEHRPDTEDPRWREGLAELRELRRRVASLCTHMTEIEDRDLFHAFGPYLWEAQEEIILLVRYLEWLAEKPDPDAWFPAEERVHNFYRRGFAVAVQELIRRDEKGRLRHGA
jgi:protein O-GlcNAcase / histone acetyltransferase